MRRHTLLTMWRHVLLNQPHKLPQGRKIVATRPLFHLVSRFKKRGQQEVGRDTQFQSQSGNGRAARHWQHGHVTCGRHSSDCLLYTSPSPRDAHES
eukprot:183057-Chlamydomonas_euryale.AAC.3